MYIHFSMKGVILLHLQIALWGYLKHEKWKDFLFMFRLATLWVAQAGVTSKFQWTLKEVIMA
jgi:hypothetical protein